MKKHIIYTVLTVFLIAFGYSPMFAQDAKEKYDAMNNYIETAVKDTTKEIIIIKEKINPNETIYIFKDYDNDKRIEKTDVNEGDITVDTLLYNEKDWEKMNKKYGDGTPFVTQTYLPEKDNWKPSDFRLKKVVYESKDRYYDSVVNGKDYPIFDKNDIYFFSEPIYYKNKRHLVFTVSYGNLGRVDSTFVVVMKKVKGKWIQKYHISPPWHS